MGIDLDNGADAIWILYGVILRPKDKQDLIKLLKKRGYIVDSFNSRTHWQRTHIDSQKKAQEMA